MQNISIIRQLNLVVLKGNRLACAIGALMGFVVPLMVYAVTHELPGIYKESGVVSLPFLALSAMAVAGCVFSAKSVYQWGVLAFADRFKAVGFAILLEGMLAMSGIVHESQWMRWLGAVALAYLMLVNAISSATNIVTHNKDCQRAERETVKTKRKK